MEICKVNKQYKFTMPIKIRNKLNIEIGQYFYCVLNKDDTITFKKVVTEDLEE